MIQNDDRMVQKVPDYFSSGFGSAQVPLIREKLKAWKGTVSRRGELPTLALGEMV